MATVSLKLNGVYRIKEPRKVSEKIILKSFTQHEVRVLKYIKGKFQMANLSMESFLNANPYLD